MSLLNELSEKGSKSDLTEFLYLNGLNLSLLGNLSVQSPGNLNLNKQIREYEEDFLINDMLAARIKILEKLENFNPSTQYRVKSVDSIIGKVKRKSGDYRINRVFNDILGFRIIVNEYPSLNDCKLLRIVDYTKGKVKDTGYRGVHIYYKKSNMVYPIEIQINTHKDRIFNDWMHILTYKRENNINIQVTLRKDYEDGKIKTFEDFRGYYNDLLHRC